MLCAPVVAWEISAPPTTPLGRSRSTFDGLTTFMEGNVSQIASAGVADEGGRLDRLGDRFGREGGEDDGGGDEDLEEHGTGTTRGATGPSQGISSAGGDHAGPRA